MPPSSDDKSRLRASLRRNRVRMGASARRAAARRLVHHAAPLLARGARIGCYLACGSELDLSWLMQRAWRQGSRLFLPRIPARGRRLVFCPHAPGVPLRRHPRYGIPEPVGPGVRAERLDILLVPLLGVDEEGYRMGQGGGFYDATLAARRAGRLSVRPRLIGVAFDCQRVARLPRDPWDIRLDGLLTESGFYRF